MSRLTIRDDGTAKVIFDHEGQGRSTIGDLTTHSFWACGWCGIPTGSRERRCPHHPEAVLFMRHVREAA